MHGFVKVLSSELSRLLQSSGAGGVFLTPKSKDASGPSTEFKFKVIGEIQMIFERPLLLPARTVPSLGSSKVAIALDGV